MGKKNVGGNAARRVKSAEDAEKALRLRRGGATYKAIGTALGFTEQRAHAIVRGELARLAAATAEAAEAIRQLELVRLDAMTMGLWPKASAGDVRSVEAMLRLMERRARYVGIEAPPPAEAGSPLIEAFGDLLRKVYAEPAPAGPEDGAGGDAGA